MILSFLDSISVRPLVRYLTNDLIQHRNGHPQLARHVRALRTSQYFSAGKLRDLQKEKLRKILSFAYENCPFYRDRFDAAGFHPATFRHLADLKKIPPLTKKDIRGHTDQMLSPLCRKQNACAPIISGGTTGPSVEVFNSRNALTQKLASQLRFDSWAGWQPGDWSSIIWPAVVDMHHNRSSFKGGIKNYLSNRSVALQQAVIEESDFERHFKAFKDKKPVIIRGFPFQVTEAARYCLQKGLQFSHIKGAITTGEPLFPAQRDCIQRAFSSPVFDSYRTREVGCIAQECAEHKGMHISAELVYIEIDDTDNIGTDQGAEKILVTDLVNGAMPIIRYEIGDIGSLSPDGCACGRGLPLLEKIGGRTSDRLFTPDGRLVSPVTVIPNLFHLIGVLNQFRIVQDRYDHLTIQMVKPAPSAEKLRMQRKAIDRIFGKTMQVTYAYVDRILQVSSGKYPFVISKIKANESTLS